MERTRAAFHAAFRLGEWTVRPAACSIERPGTVRHLRPMLMDLLVLLAENAGKVVSRDELTAGVRDERFVSESTLSRDIAVLRQLLDDDTKRPRYVETIPKRGFRLVAPVAAAEPGGAPRVAVLPFENLGRRFDDDALVDGFADALTTELARTPGLRVVSRQSMLRFRGSSRPVPQIAREVNADAVVEGSLARVDGRIRATAQLIDARSDQHLWAESCEGEAADTAVLLGRATRAFAGSIRSTLLGGEAPRPRPAPEVLAEARLEYVRYRHHFGKWSREGLLRGLGHLQRALEIDPAFAYAYEGMAWSLATLGYWGFMPIDEAYPKAKAAALRALSLDPDLSEAHVALALARWLHDWDVAGVEPEVARALELNPSNEFAHFLRGLYLATIARDRAGAEAEVRAALEIDPLSLVTNFSAAFILVFAGEYGKAAERARRTLELYPDSVLAMYALGWAQVGMGLPADALATFERAATLSPDPIGLSYVAFAQGRLGNTEAALALLDRLTHGTGDLPAFARALVHVGLSDLDEAFACLERSLAEGDSRLFWFAVLPGLEPLREDPRFAELARRMVRGAPAAAAPGP